MHEGAVDIYKPNKNYTFYPIPDFFWWGPRAVFKADMRSGETTTPDPSWLDWEEALDNEEFQHPIQRYVQHRLYAWIPIDVRTSRDRAELPQFIYRHFVLKWWGRKYSYQYTTHSTYYTDGTEHYWGYSLIATGVYQFANYNRTSPTLYDVLPVFEI